MEESADTNWEISSEYQSDEDVVIKSFISSNIKGNQDLTFSLGDAASGDMQVSCVIQQGETDHMVRINFNKYEDFSLLNSFKLSDKSGAHVFPRGTDQTCTEAVRTITRRLKDSYQLSFIYLTSSLMLDLDVTNPMRIPSNVLLDAYVVAPSRPVGIFTFLSQDISSARDDCLAYNSNIARFFTSLSRQKSFTRFLPVHGVFDFPTYADQSSFLRELQQLEKRTYITGMNLSVGLSRTACDLMIQLFVQMVFKSSSVSAALAHACQMGHLHHVKNIVTVSPDSLHIPSDNGTTPLMWACCGGHCDVVKFLMSHNVDVNIKNNRGETSLILAFGKSLIHKTLNRDNEKSLPFLGRMLAHNLSSRLVDLFCGNILSLNWQVVELLLSNGADENVVDDDGFTPLILSCISGDINLTHLLLTRGVNVNSSGILESTALTWACLFEHGMIVDSLMQAGADVNITSHFNISVLFISSYFGRESITESLISHGANIDEADESGHTALYYGTLYGFPSIVNLLISRGAQIDKSDNIGYTPLIAACWSGQSKMVEILLSRGADINHQSKDNTIPIVASAVAGHTDTVQLLLHHGADIDKRGVNNMTALMWASLAGWEDVARLLISNGADVNASDTNGETSLTLVLRDVQNVFELLTKDEDAMVRLCFYANRCDLRSLEYALHQLKHICSERMQCGILGFAYLTRNPNLLSSLKRVFSNKHDDTPSKTAVAADVRRDGILKVLLSHGADVNSRRKDGNSALHIASKGGYDTSVKMLLEQDADANVYNENADTALSIASREGHYNVVELLLNCTSVVSVREIAVQIPLIEACREGHSDVVKLLLQHGADINSVNSDGETAMKVAQQGGRVTVVDILISQSDTSELFLAPNIDLPSEQPLGIDRDMDKEKDPVGKDSDHEATSEGNNRSQKKIKKNKDKAGRSSKKIAKFKDIFNRNPCKVS